MSVILFIYVAGWIGMAEGLLTLWLAARGDPRDHEFRKACARRFALSPVWPILLAVELVKYAGEIATDVAGIEED